jgi:eukaryotic-like serine/threonine-protein kinase
MRAVCAVCAIVITAHSYSTPRTRKVESRLTLQWKTPFTVIGEPPIGTPLITGKLLIVAAAELEAYDTSGGALIWKHQFERYVPSSLVSDAGMVFVPEAAVSALNAQTGNLLWRTAITGHAALCSAIVHGGVLYVGTSTHRLYALDATNGRVIWSHDLAPDSRYAAVISGVVEADGALFVSLQEWRSPNGSETTGRLIKLEARRGTQLWTWAEQSKTQSSGFSSAPVITGHLVLVSDFAGNSIFAIDRKRGSLRWRFHGETGFAGFSEPPHVEDNVVYAASPDTFVYALRLSDGTLIWRTKMSGSNMTLGICGERLVVSYQRLALLDKRDGHVLLQDVELERGGPATSKLVIAQGDVYIAGHRGVYRFTCR